MRFSRTKQLLVFSAVYANVDSIGGWTRGEMTVFIGTFSLINAINMTLYFFGVITIPEKIINGGLDHYLTKPMNALFWISFESINPGSFLLIPGSILVILYGVSQFAVAVTVLQAVLYIILVLLMTLLWYDMEILLRSLPFFVSIQNVNFLEGALMDLNFKVPGVLFKGVFKVLFYFLLPYGIMSTIPTQALSGTLTPAGALYAAAIAVLFTALAIFVWKVGLRGYKSASS